MGWCYCIPGEEYIISGMLMDKKTVLPLLINGKMVQASKKFTPEEMNGTVDVTFEFDGTKLDGKELVVFENIYRVTDSGYEKHIASHEDINDEAQTFTVKVPNEQPKTGDTNSIALYIGLVFASILAAAILFLKRKKMD